jgi:hypothetical protein
MANLTKDQILGAEDLKAKVVDIPEWGGEVVVSELSAAARMEWELDAFGADGKPSNDNWKAKLVTRCIVDENGERMFSADDVAALGKKSSKAIDRVYVAALEVNALGDDSVEEIEKN